MHSVNPEGVSNKIRTILSDTCMALEIVQRSSSISTPSELPYLTPLTVTSLLWPQARSLSLRDQDADEVATPSSASKPSPGAVLETHSPSCPLASPARCLTPGTAALHRRCSPTSAATSSTLPTVATSGERPEPARPAPLPGGRKVGALTGSLPHQLGHHSVPPARPGPRRLPDLEQPVGALRRLQAAGRLRAGRPGQRGDHRGGHREAAEEDAIQRGLWGDARGRQRGASEGGRGPH